jgi:RNA polymerase sigma-70 factor (ECF subfamily)
MKVDHDPVIQERTARLAAAFSDDREGLLVAARPRLRRLAQLRGVAPDAIDDVVQETLLEAWKHLNRLQAPEGFHAWVDEICRNVCRRYARKKQTDLLRHVPLLYPYQFDDDEHGEAEATGILDSHSLDPVEALDRQDQTVLLNRALGSLSGTAREVVELCYLLELPQREAAMRLGLTISALEARLHRARLQLRQILSGPLRADAESLGLALDQELVAGWRETGLWCNLCGRRRLQGIFLPQPGGSVNLHLRCPDCSQLYGTELHSKGLVRLDGVRSFRPAWKRTMQGLTQQLMQALARGWYPCLYCGTPATIQLVDKDEVPNLDPGLRATPYQFWIKVSCSRCGEGAGSPCPMMMSADELVYWSHPLTRQFIMQHPRCLNGPDRAVEYAGQPAIRFQLADMSSAERLTVLADRNTLRILEIFSQ